MYFLLTLVAIILFFLIRSQLKIRKKKKSAVPPDLTQLLEQEVPYYQQLDAAEKTIFVKKAVKFLQRTHMEGVGTQVTNLDKTLIAAGAIIPVFGFKEWEYFNLTNVILYPDTFDEQYQFEGDRRNILGMVGSGSLNGQMILSQSALRAGFSSIYDSSNTAIHEFVHLLDKSDGIVDGVPQNLLQERYSEEWLHLVHSEIARIREGHSNINPYAATNDSEFLAVISEYFFKQPAHLAAHHPQLYTMLTRIFQQDPASKLPAYPMPVHHE
jgi:Mlc titration factor MtfA (ptsG expression regulator)